MTFRILTAVISSTGLHSCRDLPPFTLVGSAPGHETARVFLSGGFSRVAIQDFDRSVHDCPDHYRCDHVGRDAMGGR